MQRKALVVSFILLGIVLLPGWANVRAEDQNQEPTEAATIVPTKALERLTNLVPTVAAKLTQAAAQLEARLTQAQVKKEQVQEQVQTALAGICANVEARIALTITRYENNKERHVTNYQELKEKLQTKIDRLAERGYDVTKLHGKLTELDGLIQTFAADYALFVEGLRASQEYVCGKSEGEFRSQLQDSRVLLRQVKADALAIRLFYQQEIRPLMVELLTTDVTSTPTPPAGGPTVTEGANE